jgi:hypothetical protein
VGDVFGMDTDATQVAEHRLDEERRLDEPAIGKVREVVEMADVIAFELEARAVVMAGLKDVLDILEAVAEDQVARRLQVLAFPIELEILVLLQQRIEPESDRTHVE